MFKKSASLFLSILVTAVTLFFGSHTYTVDSANTASGGCSISDAACALNPELLTLDDEEDEDDEKLSEEYNKQQEDTAVEGLYVGQIDNNSVEISVKGKPMAFYLSDVVKFAYNFSSIKKNTAVKIKYFKNDKEQNILTSVEVVKR